MALAAPSSSTTSTTPETTEEDDAVQVVFPDKRRVLSDMKAIVDYQETQIHMAHRKIIQAENQVAVEKSRVAELQAENEVLKKKVEEAEESCVTMQWEVQQERTEYETQIDLLKGQKQTLQNQVRVGQEEVHSLLNMAKGHVSDVRTFWKNFNDTGKHLIACFPGNETSSGSGSGSGSASTSLTLPPPSPSSCAKSSNPATSSTNSSENVEGRAEAPLPVLELSCQLNDNRPKKKRLKTKSTDWRMARIESHLKSLSQETVTAEVKAALAAFMKSVLGPVQEPGQSSSSATSATPTKRMATTTVTEAETENGNEAAKRSKN